MAQTPKSMAEIEGRAPYGEAIRTVLHALDYEQEDSDVAHLPDPLVVQPASQLEIPADDDPLAHAGGSAVA